MGETEKVIRKGGWMRDEGISEVVMTTALVNGMTHAGTQGSMPRMPIPPMNTDDALRSHD